MNKDLSKEIAAAVLDHCYGYGAVNDDMIERASVVVKSVLDRQTTTVRTKDLSDKEIEDAVLSVNLVMEAWITHRAVIDADRKKNI